MTLGVYAKGYKEDWNKHLPLAMLAINNTASTVVGTRSVTPSPLRLDTLSRRGRGTRGPSHSASCVTIVPLASRRSPTRNRC